MSYRIWYWRVPWTASPVLEIPRNCIIPLGKMLFFKPQNFPLRLGPYLRGEAQMHVYIEPLNGSIDVVTSFFRRIQYTTQKIAFLF